MNLLTLKEELGNDSDLNELLDNAVERGFLNPDNVTMDTEKTLKSRENNPELHEYCQSLFSA